MGWQPMRQLAPMVATLIFVSTPLFAQELSVKDYSRELEGRARVVGELGTRDRTGEAAPQLEVVRTLIQRGQSHLANGDSDPLPRLITRIDHLTEYIRAMVGRMDAEVEADALEATASKAVAEAEVAENALAEVKARFDALEQKGL